MVETFLSSNVSINKYREMERNQEKDAIAKFIEQRFTERYISPMRVDRGKKNGFTIMAVSCLLIETLESFYQGWADSKNKSQLAFCNFFDRNARLDSFRGYSESFYKNVRCGILHQGETTGGWHVRRDGPLFDKKTKTINAKLFHDEIETALVQYCVELQRAEWSATIWKSLKRKMNAVCKNCE